MNLWLPSHIENILSERWASLLSMKNISSNFPQIAPRGGNVFGNLKDNVNDIVDGGIHGLMTFPIAIYKLIL